MAEDDIIQRVRMQLDPASAARLDKDMERAIRNASQRSARAMTAPRDELGRFMKASDQAATAFAGGWLGKIGLVGRGIFSLQGAIAGFGIGVAARGVLQANREAQSLNAQLKVTEGSAAEASERFAAIAEFAQTTPFQLGEVTQAFLDLRTAGIQPTEEMMIAFGDIASARGKNIRDFTMAVQDALTGEMERLKEFGIVSKQQGDKVSFTFNGQTTTVERTRGAILDYLQTVGQMQGVQGSMEGQMQTLNGVISNLWDNMGALARVIGEEGFNGAAMDATKQTITWTEKLAENRDMIGYWTRGIIGLIKIIGSMVANLVRTIWNSVQIVGKGIALVVSEVIFDFGSMKNAAAGFFNWIVEQLNNIPGVRIDTRMAITDLTGARQRIQSLSSSIVDDFKDIQNAWDNFDATARGAGRHFWSGGTTDEQRAVMGSFGDGSVIGSGSGVGSGAGGNTDALRTEINLMQQARQMQMLTNADRMRAWDIESTLRQQLAATNLTLAQRVDLEQKLRDIGAITGGTVKGSVTERGGPSLGFDPRDGLDLTHKMLPEKGIVDDYMSYLRDNASATADVMTQAFEGFFDAFADGIRGDISMMKGLGRAAESVGEGIVRALLGGWADYAMMRGTAALAEGLWPPNPVAYGAASLWFAAAGLARALGGRIGGGSSGGPSGVRDPGQGFTRQMAAETPFVIINMDPMNPQNPVHARQIGRAMDLEVRIGGRPAWVSKG